MGGRGNGEKNLNGSKNSLHLYINVFFMFESQAFLDSFHPYSFFLFRVIMNSLFYIP